jgi:integral membrane protein (TIGR00529 family)
MYELFSMGIALAAFIVLIRWKVKIGLAMVLTSFALEALLRVSPLELYRAAVVEWQTQPLGQTTGYLFFSLAALVNFVNVLGLAMQEANISQRLAPAIQTLFRSRRFALCTIPLLMGLLPTPGGIMLSAPMVRDLGDNIGVSRTRTAAINFFFRHQWETIWPLFPAIPLIQGMLGVSGMTLIKYNMIIPIFGSLGGVIFLLLIGIPPKKKIDAAGETWLAGVRVFWQAFWPIALVAGLHIAFNITPAIGIVVALCLFMLIHKVPLGRWRQLFYAGFEIDLVLLILGALLFKLNLQAGDSIAAVVRFFTEINLPAGVLLFILPMLVSALTGLTMPTVAITFPLLLPFMSPDGKVHLGYQTLAFSGLMCGMYLTPVHLCLTMSAGYFQTSLGKIVAMLIAPTLCVAAAGILAAILFNL